MTTGMTDAQLREKREHWRLRENASPGGTLLTTMTSEVTEWLEEKGWNDDRTFGDCIALAHSELSEALEEYRVGRIQTKYERLGGGSVCNVPQDEEQRLLKPVGVGSEFADELIRLLDNCQRYDIDLFVEFRRKMDYNWHRPHRHGGKAL